jgi:YD repeat-containing protein
MQQVRHRHSTRRIAAFVAMIVLPFAVRAYASLPSDASASPAHGTASTSPIHERHEKHATFAYDAVGNLLTASNEMARLSFTYDVMDRLATATTAVSNATFTAAYARDAGGLVTNLVYVPGKIVARTYDADGRLVTNQTARWSGSARRCPAAGPRCACRRIRAGGSFQAPPPARHRTRCRSAGPPAARRRARLRRPPRP